MPQNVVFICLFICFLIGFVPLLLAYLSDKMTPSKWRWTAFWAGVWFFPPFTKLYVIALG